MVSISSHCLSFRIIFSFLTLIKQASPFIIPPEENKIEVMLLKKNWTVKRFCFKLYDDGAPIVRFLPRREGEMKNEVFVKPAKVRNVIPVVDRVGVLDQGERFSFTLMFLFIIFLIKTL